MAVSEQHNSVMDNNTIRYDIFAISIHTNNRIEDTENDIGYLYRECVQTVKTIDSKR